MVGGDTNNHFDEEELTRLFKILEHPLRRDVIRALHRNKSLGFTDLMKQLGVEKTGSLSFHLEALSPYLEQDERRRYSLSKEGEKAAKLLETSISTDVKPKTNPGNTQKIFFAIIALMIMALSLSSYLLHTKLLEIETEVELLGEKLENKEPLATEMEEETPDKGLEEKISSRELVDTTPPRVVATFPENGARDVDPSIREIWVKFSEPMLDKHWSWVTKGEGEFPETTGEPYYTENCTKNVLPVRLKPNTSYVISG